MRRPLAVVLLAALLLVPVGLAVAPAGEGRVAPALAARVAAAPDALTEGFVSVEGRVLPEDVARLQAAGLVVHRAFRDFGVLHASGPGSRLLEVASLPRVTLVSGNEVASWHLNTATVATNARAAWDDRSTSTSPVVVGGDVVDGSGVGVAVVDSGVDATHPDLAGAVVGNRKFVCPTPTLVHSEHRVCYGAYALSDLVGPDDPACVTDAWVTMTNTDTTVGHGTHVAGIVAGRGVASAGRHTGAAPGASVYSFGAGEATMAFGLEAFAWIHCYHDAVTPKIRVVTNSWGSAGAFDPEDPLNKAVRTLVDEDGLVVVFSAGNDGCEPGSSPICTGANRLSRYARSPVPGVVSVANYDDADTGTRTGAMDDSTSRGSTSDTQTDRDWPDVSAPGAGILAPRAKTGAAVAALGHPAAGGGRFLCCDLSQNEYMADYVSVSGTSMAAPHVAGIVALLLQAKPTLTPAEVEDILEDTSSYVVSAGAVRADPSNPTTLTNHIAGHGLVDALAALRDPRVGATGGSTLPRLGAGTAVFVGGLVNPQANSHVAWKVPAGTVGLAKTNFASGGTPVGVGTSLRFVVDGGTPLATTVALVGTGPSTRASVTTTLAPGLHDVEVQILDGGVWRAFDGFVVEAV